MGQFMTQQGLALLSQSIQSWQNRRQQAEMFQQGIEAEEQRLTEERKYQESVIQEQREYAETQAEEARKQENLANRGAIEALQGMGMLPPVSTDFVQQLGPAGTAGIMPYLPSIMGEYQATQEEGEVTARESRQFDVMSRYLGTGFESLESIEDIRILLDMNIDPFEGMRPETAHQTIVRMIGEQGDIFGGAQLYQQMGQDIGAFTQLLQDAGYIDFTPEWIKETYEQAGKMLLPRGGMGGGGGGKGEYSVIDISPEDYYRLATSLGGIYTEPVQDDPNTPWVDEGVQGGWERPYGLTQTQFNKEILDAYTQERGAGEGDVGGGGAFQEALRQYMDWMMNLTDEPVWWAGLTETQKNEINDTASKMEPVL